MDPSGDAAGVLFWSRRLFGEACVHRADAAAALDLRYELAPEPAVAALEDWPDTMTSRGYWRTGPTSPMRSAAAARPFISTRSTRPGSGWPAGNRTWSCLERTDGEADLTVRGPAAELLLVLTRRRPLDAVPALDIEGDRALLDHWIEHMDWVTG